MDAGRKSQRFWKMVEDSYLALDPQSLQYSLAHHMEYSQARTRHDAAEIDWYKSLALAIRDRVMEMWNDTHLAYYQSNAKRVYYLSLEYLLGRLIANAITNLDAIDTCRKILTENGHVLENLVEVEPDAGLGNGGLGRLAACFLDSLATLQLPATAYGIRYEYGIFEQGIRDGWQQEKPDNWLRDGYPWEIVRPERSFTVRFYGRTHLWTDEKGLLRCSWDDAEKVVAIPYDLPVPGYKNDTVNTLRLWSAKAAEEFDLHEFNKGEYVSSVEAKVISENISKVLYPKDDILPGRELRLKQEYFFVSATVQDIVRRFKTLNPSFEAFPDKVAIQLNDTHPAIAIPELMRILVDVESLPWEQAWDICVRTFGYTNHTIMPEALEKWPVELVGRLLPRHLQIIYEINRRFLDDVRERHPGDDDRVRRMSIIEESPVKSVRMAHLAVVGSHSVNGVAELHTSILRKTLFSDFHALWPERFNNKTNGITQRRWLLLSNPRLSRTISKRIGDGWTTDLYELRKLLPLADDREFSEEWLHAKRENKRELAAYVREHDGPALDVDSLFDVQVKRLHEYKRQLLNVLHIVGLYLRMKDDPAAAVVPRTFIFAGKAAPGYYTAKLIIKMINAVGDLVNADPVVAGRLKVVFLANYGVSLAQRIFPAADVSEQISTAGYEASGTGNMKFALNGAVTVGTLDGANVEIQEEVGPENIFIFGLHADEVVSLRQQGYDPWAHYAADPELKRVIDAIAGGLLSPSQPDLFRPIIDSLLRAGDRYMVLADYPAYAECQARVAAAYLDRDAWARLSIRNAAGMGKFSSDRTIAEYARDIWGVTPVRPQRKEGHQLLKTSLAAAEQKEGNGA